MPGPAPASGLRATIWRSRPGSTGSQLGEKRTPGSDGDGSGTRTLATGYSSSRDLRARRTQPEAAALAVVKPRRQRVEAGGQRFRDRRLVDAHAIGDLSSGQKPGGENVVEGTQDRTRLVDEMQEDLRHDSRLEVDERDDPQRELDEGAELQLELGRCHGELGHRLAGAADRR